MQGLPDGEAPPSGKSSEYIQMRSKGVGHQVWHQHLAIVHLQPITILARHARRLACPIGPFQNGQNDDSGDFVPLCNSRLLILTLYHLLWGALAL